MKNIIACRPGCFGVDLPEGLELLKRSGLTNAEINFPEDDDFAGLAKTAANAGVTVTSLSGGVKLDNAESVDKLGRVIKGAAEIGTKIIFLSTGVEKVDPEEGLDTLRQLANDAHAAGVVLSIETHEPYAYNGDLARKTIETVNSPGIGHNFDTANIYYYNPKGIDAVEELKKILPYVTSVHLKESGKGEPRAFDFPALGTGIVNFPEVFRILAERDFYGPYTMELEGPLVDGLPADQRVEKVRECVNYLKSIDVME